MNIFIAFANQDRDVRDKLLRQMNLVKDRQGWNIWSAKEIKAGERWDEEIKQRLIDSEVVILLLSTDFFNSKYIIETELPKVVEKHKLGDCQIIPVIARVCHWKDTPFGEYAQLGEIQALPVGERPIMSKGHWGHEDEPYFETVEGIKGSINAIQAKKMETLAVQQAKEDKARQQAQEDHARSEQERQETEQRIQRELEKSQRVKAAEAQKAKEAETKRTKETNRANQIAWQQVAAWEKASGINNIKAYQTFLSQFPQGPRALEAHGRIQEIKRQKAAALPWLRYAAVGGGGLVLVLILWLSVKMFSGREESQLPESSKLSGSCVFATSGQPSLAANPFSFTHLSL